MEIKLAETDTEILACYPVMRELRPHILGLGFVNRIRTQQAAGWPSYTLRKY